MPNSTHFYICEIANVPPTDNQDEEMQDNYFSNVAAGSIDDNLTYMPVIALVVGMEVVALDKPWAESSFLTQGFTIKSASDIEALRAECHHVYIEQEEELKGMSMIRGSIAPAVFDWSNPPGGRII